MGCVCVYVCCCRVVHHAALAWWYSAGRPWFHLRFFRDSALQALDARCVILMWAVLKPVRVDVEHVALLLKSLPFITHLKLGTAIIKLCVAVTNCSAGATACFRHCRYAHFLLRSLAAIVQYVMSTWSCKTA